MMRPPIPYGRHSIDQDDIAAVVAALSSDWLTTGPLVVEFEQALAATVGAREAVAVSSGTAALHCAMAGLGIGAGDEVIIPAMTFAATANCVVYQGAVPVFADVDPTTLLLDPQDAERKMTPRTRAVIAVDYAGQACEYDSLRALTAARGLALVSDACHGLGGAYRQRPIGSLADLSCFSFHPVKHITTGEGGAVACDDPALAARMRRFRNHGIGSDSREREARGTWMYQMEVLGFNYRITDIQCALGLSQLRKLSRWVARRRSIAARYTKALCGSPLVPLKVRPEVEHAYHLYVVRLEGGMGPRRAQVFQDLRRAGIGVNVHYLPVHLHPYYRTTFGTGPGLCPVAERAYEHILTLPLFPTMNDEEVDRVIMELAKVSLPYSEARA